MSNQIVIQHVTRRAFRCCACGQIDAYEDFGAKPVHCNQGMAPQDVYVASGDPDILELAILTIDHRRTATGFPTSDRDWPSWWTEAYELWCFRDGRNRGERIGWVGKANSVLVEKWEWLMPGCTPSEGVVDSRAAAIARMWVIINSVG